MKEKKTGFQIFSSRIHIVLSSWLRVCVCMCVCGGRWGVIGVLVVVCCCIKYL